MSANWKQKRFPVSQIHRSSSVVLATPESTEDSVLIWAVPFGSRGNKTAGVLGTCWESGLLQIDGLGAPYIHIRVRTKEGIIRTTAMVWIPIPELVKVTSRHL